MEVFSLSLVDKVKSGDEALRAGEELLIGVDVLYSSNVIGVSVEVRFTLFVEESCHKFRITSCSAEGKQGD